MDCVFKQRYLLLFFSSWAAKRPSSVLLVVLKVCLSLGEMGPSQKQAKHLHNPKINPLLTHHYTGTIVRHSL